MEVRILEAISRGRLEQQMNDVLKDCKPEDIYDIKYNTNLEVNNPHLRA